MEGSKAGVSEVKVFVAQSCPTLCDPMVCSPPGSSVHGILQARILKWVALPFSRGPSWPRDWTGLSCTAVRFCTLWAIRDAQGGINLAYLRSREGVATKTWEALAILNRQGQMPQYLTSLNKEIWYVGWEVLTTQVVQAAFREERDLERRSPKVNKALLRWSGGASLIACRKSWRQKEALVQNFHFLL